ncbi:MAG: tetratricopeptide repeat protein [Solirubrobacteraceae bacterium]
MNSGQWCYPRGVIDPPGSIVLPGGPLQLYERGMWDPAAQYWGEPEDTIAASIAQVIAGGTRMEFEFEQILPGHGDPDSDDAIIDAMELRDRGDAAAASSLLGGLLERDARCLDAHAHLGVLAFNAGDVQLALGHYATGVQIAERSLPEPFSGVLPWGRIDNRPFLRCLHGLAVTAWRLGEHDSAETLCWALLWLSPGDNQGVSGLLPEITAGARWHA